MLKAVSIIGYLAMVAGLLGLLFMRCIFSAFAPVVVVQAAAIVLMLWARLTFGRRSFHFVADPTEGGLVTRGPYRFIRHPIYAAMCLFSAAGVAAHVSPGALVLLALIGSGAAARMFCEERLLREKYPEYKQYAARTARLIPFVF